MAGVNAFSNETRQLPCGNIVDEGEDGIIASALYDTAIALSTIFHMIDWLRWTLLLTAALVGVNLLPGFYYLTAINLPFGIIACIVAIITRFGTDGAACADEAEGRQASRAFYLGLQVVCLVIYLPTFLAHIVYMRIRGTEWCHTQFIFEEEEEEEE
jgi:hypothetical protein